MVSPSRALVACLLLLAPSLAGCLDAGHTEGHDVRIETGHDRGLTAEDERSRTPGEAYPARNGTVNAYLFTPEDLEAMEGEWGLWDPVAPPERAPGEELDLSGNETGAFPLDEEGRTGFDVDAPEGTVLALWVWGSTESDGAHGCDGRFFYVSPDEPAATATMAGNRTTATIEVPFGMGCSEG